MRKTTENRDEMAAKPGNAGSHGDAEAWKKRRGRRDPGAKSILLRSIITT
jgi:hypothetical protein